MKKIIITTLLTAMLCACAAPSQSYTYQAPSVRGGVISSVTFGQILSVRPVTIDGGTSYIGMGTGAAVGAIAGSSIGHNRGSAIAGILGGVAGGAIGSSIQQGMQNVPGVELVIVNQYKQTVAISQPNTGEIFLPGDIVKIINGSPTRVTH
ncbi:17 kDa surface antigen [Caballeronia peredens]|nr:17 kDa surface antigen [Caballeronia peredens]